MNTVVLKKLEDVDLTELDLKAKYMLNHFDYLDLLTYTQHPTARGIMEYYEKHNYLSYTQVRALKREMGAISFRKNSESTSLIVYVGACGVHNPDVGGWCYGVRGPNDLKSGSVLGASWANMAVYAVVRALEDLSKHAKQDIVIRTNCKYLLDNMNQRRLATWCKTNWKTKEGRDVQNKEIWKKILMLLGNRKWSVIEANVNTDGFMRVCDTEAKGRAKTRNYSIGFSAKSFKRR